MCMCIVSESFKYDVDVNVSARGADAHHASDDLSSVFI